MYTYTQLGEAYASLNWILSISVNLVIFSYIHVKNTGFLKSTEQFK